MTQVFISYSRKDLDFVERLAADLQAAGLRVWYDLSGLEGGDRWSRVIEQAIRDSQFVLVVLSPDSVESEWVEKEVLFAIGLKRKIVPVLHRPCDMPMFVANLQCISLMGGDYARNLPGVLKIFGARQPAPAAGLPRQKTSPEAQPAPTPHTPPVFVSSEEKAPAAKAVAAPQPTGKTPAGIDIYTFGGMQFVKVPAGKFIMGSKYDSLAWDDEKPRHMLEIPYDYWIGRFPVTWAEYAPFGTLPPAGRSFKIPKGKNNHPVVNVSWKDALKFLAWLNERHGAELPPGYRFTLPSEAEWEKAARGERGNIWPWGNAWDPERCNSREGGPGGTTPVGKYSPAGDSPYGAADMVGNIWEWTRSLWGKYPYPAAGPERAKREDLAAMGNRVVRGGAFSTVEKYARCAVRGRLDPGFWDGLRGFRAVLAPVLNSGL